MYLDSSIVLLVPALLLAMWANFKVKATYAKYAKVGTRAGISGAEAAQRILREANIALVNDPERYPAGSACGLEVIGGELSDHYDPRSRTLRLSQDIFHGHSVAALGIAAHEVGHAIQHARLYSPLMMRNIIYPVCNIGSSLAFPLFLGGLFVFQPLIYVAILLYSAAVFFTVLTLPVEFDASRRALMALESGGYLAQDELAGARKVLSAAAMTYVAAAAMAILQLVRMVLLANRR